MKKTTSFQVSDKVVCIAPARGKTSFRPMPVVGRVYVVRELVAIEDDDEPGMRLVGITGRKGHRGEFTHDPNRYRLLADVQAGKQLPQQEAPQMVSVPILKMRAMSDERFNELAKMDADVCDLIRAGRDGEALDLICRTLRHDCPIRHLLFMRETAALGWTINGFPKDK